MVKQYKLFNTDGKTFFDFRSDPNSRCEGFTITFCDDGTVVMSGDYGTLCWKREYSGRKDYGFPNKETGIGYFAEKVCQWGVPQKIREWNKEKAIGDLKEKAREYSFEKSPKYKEALEEIEWLEEYQDQRFNEIISEQLSNYDLWECDLGIKYTDQFVWNFERLQSVSEQILEEVNKQKGGLNSSQP